MYGNLDHFGPNKFRVRNNWDGIEKKLYAINIFDEINDSIDIGIQSKSNDSTFQSGI